MGMVISSRNFTREACIDLKARLTQGQKREPTQEEVQRLINWADKTLEGDDETDKTLLELILEGFVYVCLKEPQTDDKNEVFVYLPEDEKKEE